MLRNDSRRPLAALLAIVVGAVLLVFAAIDLTGAPERAHRAFDDLVASMGGSMTHSATHPDTYRAIAASTIVVRDALIGAGGVALVGVGAGALVRDRSS